MPEQMTEDEFVTELEELFHSDDALFGEVRTSTFRDSGLLTMDQGLVVRLSDGSEFQLTVRRSA